MPQVILFIKSQRFVEIFEVYENKEIKALDQSAIQRDTSPNKRSSYRWNSVKGVLKKISHLNLTVLAGAIGKMEI